MLREGGLDFDATHYRPLKAMWIPNTTVSNHGVWINYSFEGTIFKVRHSKFDIFAIYLGSKATHFHPSRQLASVARRVSDRLIPVPLTLAPRCLDQKVVVKAKEDSVQRRCTLHELRVGKQSRMILLSRQYVH